MSARTRIALAAAVAALSLAAAAAPASAATFSNPNPIIIQPGGICTPGPFGFDIYLPREAAPYPSTIGVSGLQGQVTDVDVTLTGFTHSRTASLRVLLVGPGGQGPLLLHDDGPGANNLTLTFDDAGQVLPTVDGAWTPGGSYRPSEQNEFTGGCNLPDATAETSLPNAPNGPYGSALGGFNGTNPNGTWRLYVVDQLGRTGSIGGWSLDITTNLAPVARDDFYVHDGADTPLVVSAQGGVLSNDSDANNDALFATKVTDPSNGSVTLDGDGSFSYQPDEDFVGTDSFTYKVDDGIVYSNTATVWITVGEGCDGQPATIVGTSAGDKLKGTDGNDVIVGLGGGDTIVGGAGNDSVCGGSGDDSIDGGSGDDRADGGSGDDRVNGGSGNDTLLGNADVDFVGGGAGNDSLSGGLGSPDSCKGDSGTDNTFPASHGCEQIKDVP
jgi:VCBS repeat-containing protein